jgi:lipopolysaccharide/colanic/teichoic acid biosynthesis glycosyltransferase
MGLLILSPMILLVSLAIKLDSRGPIFSVQIQHSYGNKIIRVLRFRNSFIQPDQRESSLTRIGRVLSWTGIEGLPMLVNVLRGEMSIVGPCLYATAPRLLDEHALGLARNNELEPGLTGWAQVRAPAKHETSHARREQVEDDLFYIVNWSLRFDARIILTTLLSKHFYVLK